MVGLGVVVQGMDNNSQTQKDRRERIAKFSYNTGCIAATLDRCHYYFVKDNNEELYTHCLKDGEVICEANAEYFTQWIYQEVSF